MRLIDADALRKGIREAAMENDVTVLDVLTTIDFFPTIEAKPVRHGRWMPVTCENHPKIILGCTGYMCSECGRIEEENSEPYCHCGAKMDGGDPHD